MGSPVIAVVVALQLVSIAPGGSAAPVTVIDKKGVKTEIEKLKADSVEFWVGEFEWRIPVKMITALSLAPNGNAWVLRTTGGVDLTGTCYKPDKLEGTSELRDYAVSFSDIKSVVFARGTATPTQPLAPTGFVLRVKARNGGTFQLSDAALSYQTYGLDRSWAVPRSYAIKNRRFFLPVAYKHCIIAVPFADIDRLISPGLTNESQSKAEVLLRSGRKLDCQTVRLGNAHERITGKAPFGECAVGLRTDKGKILEIVFGHEKPAKPVRQGFEKELGGRLDSPYTIALVTWDGTKLELANACVVAESDWYEWGGQRDTTFKVTIGESEEKVSLDRIKRLDFEKWKHPGEGAFPPILGKMTTDSGKTLDISLRCWWGLAGNLGDLGPAILKLTEIRSLEIRRKER